MKNNILIVDKPKGISSNQKLMEIKKELSIKKCGFVGTLDPFATGLLIVCCGKYTKLVDYFHSFSKTYIAEIKFGETTPTLDPTSEINYSDEFKLDKKKLVEALKTFDEYDQMPPAFSAKRVNGKRAYELARENKEVKLKTKRVKISDAELLDIDIKNNIATCKFSVSAGTYIRTLCDDLAIKLGTRSYLLNLRRTDIGEINVTDESIDITKVFDIPSIEIQNDFELRLVRNGQIPKNVDLSTFTSKLLNVTYKGKNIGLFTPNGKVVFFYD